MEKIELLSPAGNMECLKAAIEGGCDAIYLGGRLFGARAYANNFDDEELIEAINYAHLYGVKIYVTTNILVYEHEINRFMEYVDFLYKNNVDALIIQDLGMLDLVHKTYPNLELHASTQMHIHNKDSVIMAKKLGVKRVVLARETSIDVIKDIKENIDIDLEIFAHGALCVSYSGQCLFSSLIGNRSGNRGSCVGSCRLKYDILDENDNKLNDGEYPLSMKDLNTLEYVGELIDANVTSLKIEGRMKGPEYVYTVTKLYREAIDSYYKNKKVLINQKLFKDLQIIFQRGYTKGYLFNENMNNIINNKRPNHQGIEIGTVIDYQNNYIKIKLKENVSINDGLRILDNDEDYGFILNQFYINKKLVKEASKGDIISLKVNKKININSKVLITKDDSLNREIEDIINKKNRKVEVNISVKALLNEKLELSIRDSLNTLTVYGNIITNATNNPTTRGVIIEKIGKIGNTIYKINNININLSENIFIPVSELNNLKRELFKNLDEKRLSKREYLKKDYYIDLPDFKEERLRSIYTNLDVSNYDIVYSDNKNIIRLDRVMDNYDNLDSNKEYLIGELGGFNKLKNVNTDFSLNVTNSYTVALLHSLGAKRITLSYELLDKQIENIINEYHNRYKKHPNLEKVVYGNLEVMVLKTNLNKIYHHNTLYLLDKYHNKYKIIEKNNRSYIYDYKCLNNINNNYYEMGINVLRENKCK